MTLYPPPFKGVVPTQPSSNPGLGPYWGTKEWMALWPVDHAAHVDTSKSPRTAPTCRLGGRT